MMQSTLSHAVTGLLGGAAVLAASGCGTATDAERVRAAAEGFYAAVRQQDGRAACAQLSPPTRKELVGGESEPACAKAVLELRLRSSRAAAVRVYATSTQVQLVGGDTVFLGDTRFGVADPGGRLQAPGHQAL